MRLYDGQESILIKCVYLLRKRSEMSDEQFFRYWIDKHAALAKDLPGLRKYVINRAITTDNQTPDYDGFAELWFDSHELAKAAFASSIGRLVEDDARNFMAEEVSLVVAEHVIL